MNKFKKSIIAAVVAGGLSAMFSAPAFAADKNIIVLTSPEDHGWTGSVATFAKEKAKEITAQGKYDVNVITCENAGYQINQIEDIIAQSDKKLAGIVI